MKCDVVWLVEYLASCIEEHGITADVVVVERSFYRRLQLGLATNGTPSMAEISGVSVAGVMLVKCEESDMARTMIRHGDSGNVNVLAVTKSPGLCSEHNIGERLTVEKIMTNN
jgi:hypothetical protein